jgi:hypothetical protein
MTRMTLQPASARFVAVLVLGLCLAAMLALVEN